MGTISWPSSAVHSCFLKLDDELESDLYLDGIVSIVDAKHILFHLDEKKAEVRIAYFYYYYLYLFPPLCSKRVLSMRRSDK